MGGEQENDGTEVDVSLTHGDGTLGGIIGDDMDNKKKGAPAQEKRNMYPSQLSLRSIMHRKSWIIYH